MLVYSPGNSKVLVVVTNWSYFDSGFSVTTGVVRCGAGHSQHKCKSLALLLLAVVQTVSMAKVVCYSTLLLTVLFLCSWQGEATFGSRISK